MLKINKKYQIIGGIILLAIIIVSQIIYSKKPQKQTVDESTIISTDTKTNTFPRTNPYESSEVWNRMIEEDLNKYLKTDKARIDETLSQVRLNSPIIKDTFTIEFSYVTSTYTISVKEPAVQSQQDALNWLKSLGISLSDLNYINVIWITSSEP